MEVGAKLLGLLIGQRVVVLELWQASQELPFILVDSSLSRAHCLIILILLQGEQYAVCEGNRVKETIPITAAKHE